jgi:hypothetical protein
MAPFGVVDQGMMTIELQKNRCVQQMALCLILVE